MANIPDYLQNQMSENSLYEYKVHSKKVWIRSLPGEARIDVASGIYPTKSDHPVKGH